MFEDFAKNTGHEQAINNYEGLSQLVTFKWLYGKLIDKQPNKEDFNAQEISEAIKEVMDDTNNIVMSLDDENEIIDIFNTFAYKKREEMRVKFNGFLNRLENYYGLEFFYLEAVDILSRDLLYLFEKHFNNMRKTSQIVNLLCLQYERALTIFSEIVYLLKGGFANGALTRFRTLHELTVITEFIYEHGEEAADRYLDYRYVMEKRDIDYKEKELGIIEDDKEFIKELNINLDRIKKEKGNEFVNSRNDYIWAKPFLKLNPNQKPTFHQIFKVTRSEKQGGKQYKDASNNIHSGPKSLNSSINTMNGAPIVGASNFGFNAPASYSTYEMVQLGTLLNLEFGNYISQLELNKIELITPSCITALQVYLKIMINKGFFEKEKAIIEDENQ